MLTENSKIVFYKLHYAILPDKHNLYLLARSGSKESLRVDTKIIEIVGLLSKGKTIKEAANSVGYSVDVVNTIIKLLQKSNLIKSIDHKRYDKERFTENSQILFHRLRSSKFPDENDLYALVRWDTDDSLLVDKKVIEVIDLLNTGKTVKQAAIGIGYSTDVVMTILKMLEDANFFKSIDHNSLDDRTEKLTPWFSGVNRKWFQWVLYKPFIYALLSISISGILVGLITTGIPSYKTYFWSSDLFTVFVSLFLSEIILVFLHELSHFITTKAVGGEAMMRINYRYIFLVAETESYHLAVIPKKMRYAVYLSGLMLDLLVIGSIYWFICIAFFAHWQLGIAYKLLLAVVLTEILGIIWQFNVFLETDIYNFLSDYLGIENLRSDALKFIDTHIDKTNKLIFIPIKRLLSFFSKEEFKNTDDFRFLRKTEKKKIYLYVVLLVIGLTFTTLEYVFYTIPRDFTFIVQSIETSMVAMRQSNFFAFIKSLTIIIMVLFEYSLLIILKLREKK